MVGRGGSLHGKEKYFQCLEERSLIKSRVVGYVQKFPSTLVFGHL